MSIGQIKDAIEGRSADEFADLAEFVRAKQLEGNSEYRARVERAHRQIETGRYVTLEQLKDLVAKNEAASGRAS